MNVGLAKMSDLGSKTAVVKRGHQGGSLGNGRLRSVEAMNCSEDGGILKVLQLSRVLMEVDPAAAATTHTQVAAQVHQLRESNAVLTQLSAAKLGVTRTNRWGATKQGWSKKRDSKRRWCPYTGLFFKETRLVWKGTTFGTKTLTEDRATLRN